MRTIPQENLVWKANEDDPTKHVESHEGLFYQLPDSKNIAKIFGATSPFDKETEKHYNILGHSPLMIRKPSLTAMDYIKNYNPNMPNLRLLFYGDPGHGKTHVLAHLIHYLHSIQEHLIIHVREMKRFTIGAREVVESQSRQGRLDTPLGSAILLQQFRVQNAALLEKYNDTLVCSKSYKWSLREVTEAGEPLIKVAEHGVNRVNHASDCLAVLFKELTLAADEGKIKLATVIDNVNFLFHREAMKEIKHPDLKQVLIDEITVARGLKKLITGTHKGSILLATCDNKLTREQNQTPKQVLGLDGWNSFDPCLPIHVGKYSRKEFESCMNMYQDIGWIARPEARTEEVRNELRFVSGLNPGQLKYLCGAI